MSFPGGANRPGRRGGARGLRRYAPLQIVHGAAGEAAAAGRLDAFLDRLAALGLGGIVVNYPPDGYLCARVGWESLRQAVRGAAARGLRLWLYDEEGYPSGAAGGIVLSARPELEAIGLSWAWLPLDVAEGGTAVERWRVPAMAESLVGVWRFPTGRGGLPMWRGRECLAPEGALLTPPLSGLEPGGREQVGVAFTRRLYEGTHAERNFHASRRMVNVLHRDAGEAFVAVTHERYAAELGPLLRHVEAVFTDEPSWIAAFVPSLGTRRVEDRLSPPPVQYPALPWAPDMSAAFAAEHGEDLLASLPLLFLDFPDAAEEARHCRARFHSLAARLYGERYFEPIGAWGRRHGVASSGHVLGEEGLVTHAAFEGDLMAQLRRLDWPGCDVLDSDPRSILEGDLCLTARFAASAARLTGAAQVMCEISDFVQRHRDGKPATPAAMRGAAFALCALGVGVYASYYRPGGEQGDGGYRSWCRAAARACRIVREWEPLADVALLYPIRALWELFVPSAEDFRAAVGRDSRYAAARAVSAGFGALARQLLRRHVPFEIVDEAAVLSAVPGVGTDGRPELRCGAAGARYRVIVLTAGTVLTQAVQQALLRWIGGGGAVVAVDAGPAAAAGEGPLVPRLEQALERMDAASGGLWERLRHAGSAAPRVGALAGDVSAVLAAPFQNRDGRSGLMLANTAGAPVRLAVELPTSGGWLRTDLATGSARVLRSGGGKEMCPVGVAAYGGLWLSPQAEPVDA